MTSWKRSRARWARPGRWIRFITLKRKRTDVAATLSVTGRDVDEMVYSVTFMEGKWHAADGSLSAAAKKAGEPQLSDKMVAVLEFVNARELTTATDLVENLPDIKGSTARQYLNRMASRGLIRRIAAGVYGPVTVSQVSQEEAANVYTVTPYSNYYK